MGWGLNGAGPTDEADHVFTLFLPYPPLIGRGPGGLSANRVSVWAVVLGAWAWLPMIIASVYSFGRSGWTTPDPSLPAPQRLKERKEPSHWEDSFPE